MADTDDATRLEMRWVPVIDGRSDAPAWRRTWVDRRLRGCRRPTSPP